jgi:predicted membrane GTPase involved in stress response
MSFSVNTSPFAGREVLSACPCSFPYFTTFCIHLFSLNFTYGCHLLSAVCLFCAEIFLEFLVRDPSFLTVNICFIQGKYVTSRNLRDRLYRELERNLAMKVTDGETADTFVVSGRGTLHITILIENM